MPFSLPDPVIKAVLPASERLSAILYDFVNLYDWSWVMSIYDREVTVESSKGSNPAMACYLYIHLENVVVLLILNLSITSSPLLTYWPIGCGKLHGRMTQPWAYSMTNTDVV